MRFFLLLSLLGFAPSLLADWYQVEVILFQHLNADTDGEFWSENPGLPDREGSIQLIEPGETAAAEETAPPSRVPYQALSTAHYRLNGVEGALRLAREYRPLLHVAWQQPGQGADRSRAVHLERLRSQDAQTVDRGRPAPGGGGYPSNFVVPDPLLEGTVRLRISRFLHVDVDMAFFPERAAAPAPAQTPAAGDGAAELERQSADYVRLRQSRKIKLNELHYFDHPLFGVIVQVSRLQFPEARGGIDPANSLR